MLENFYLWKHLNKNCPINILQNKEREKERDFPEILVHIWIPGLVTNAGVTSLNCGLCGESGALEKGLRLGIGIPSS